MNFFLLTDKITQNNRRAKKYFVEHDVTNHLRKKIFFGIFFFLRKNLKIGCYKTYLYELVFYGGN